MIKVTPAERAYINAYLQQTLSAKEMADFEEVLSKDESLRNLVVKELLTHQVLQRYYTQQQVGDMHKIMQEEWLAHPPVQLGVYPDADPAEDSEMQDEDYARNPYRRRPLAFKVLVGLTLALLLGFSIFYYLAKRPLPLRVTPVTSDSVQALIHDKLMSSKELLLQEQYLGAVPDIMFVEEHPAATPEAKANAHWFKIYAFSDQLPYSAQDLFDTMRQAKAFPYRHSRFERLQLWCRIQWSKLMGWKG